MSVDGPKHAGVPIWWRRETANVAARLRTAAELHGMPWEAIDAMRTAASDLERLLTKEKADGLDKR